MHLSFTISAMGAFPKLTAEEAAEFIPNDALVACSGFTAAGCPKVIPLALAKRAERLHDDGKPFQIKLLTGASTNDAVDGALGRARAIAFRAPYQADRDLRKFINDGDVVYIDDHLSRYGRRLRQNFFGNIDIAIIEVSHYMDDGELTLTTAVGSAPVFCRNAKYILLEHNTYHEKIAGFHDLYNVEPNNAPVPLRALSDHIGTKTLRVDLKKILGVVETNLPDGIEAFKPCTLVHEAIAGHVVDFLLREIRRGIFPSTSLTMELGTGNLTNAVLKHIGACEEMPKFSVHGEVLQDGILELTERERIEFAVGSSLTVTEPWLQKIYEHADFYKERLLLRPSEITNHPEVIQRLNLVALNAALEADIFGNINSTHVTGTSVMNGIGGASDFAHNAALSIFMLPSTAKDGKISSMVPLCSHIDLTEHDVDVIVTEQGLADLRGKSPEQRALCVIENCAHPDYKPFLRAYLQRSLSGHIRHDLNTAFAFYDAYAKTGDMRNAQL